MKEGNPPINIEAIIAMINLTIYAGLFWCLKSFGIIGV